MQLKTDLTTIYKPINTLYSANFTCARIAHQNGYSQKINNNIYTREDLYGKNSSNNYWISRKLSDISNRRNAMISNLREYFGPNDPDIFKFKIIWRNQRPTSSNLQHLVWPKQNV